MHFLQERRWLVYPSVVSGYTQLLSISWASNIPPMHSCLCKGVGSSVAPHLLSRQHLQLYIPTLQLLSHWVLLHLWRVMNVTITTTFTLGITPPYSYYHTGYTLGILHWITPPYNYCHTGYTLGTHWVPLYKLWPWDPANRVLIITTYANDHATCNHHAAVPKKSRSIPLNIG